MPLPAQVSESTRRLNPKLFPAPNQKVVQAGVKLLTHLYSVPDAVGLLREGTAPRLRQKTGPKLNKTETAFYLHLVSHIPGAKVMPHAITLVLANGCRYTPDFYVEMPEGRDRFYETKGFMRDDAAVKLKVAASTFTRFDFYLASRKKGGRWEIQRIFP